MPWARSAGRSGSGTHPRARAAARRERPSCSARTGSSSKRASRGRRRKGASPRRGSRAPRAPRRRAARRARRERPETGRRGRSRGGPSRATRPSPGPRRARGWWRPRGSRPEGPGPGAGRREEARWRGRAPAARALAKAPASPSSTSSGTRPRVHASAATRSPAAAIEAREGVEPDAPLGRGEPARRELPLEIARKVASSPTGACRGRRAGRPGPAPVRRGSRRRPPRSPFRGARAPASARASAPAVPRPSGRTRPGGRSGPARRRPGRRRRRGRARRSGRWRRGCSTDRGCCPRPPGEPGEPESVQADGSREAARALAKSSVKSPIHVRGGEGAVADEAEEGEGREVRPSSGRRCGTGPRPGEVPRAGRGRGRKPGVPPSGEPCASRRVAARPPRASIAPPDSASPCARPAGDGEASEAASEMRARARSPVDEGGPAVQSRSVRANRRAGAWNRSSSKEPESASSRFPARSPSAISGRSRAIRSMRARSTAVTSSASSSVKASSGSERPPASAPDAMASATSGRAHAGASAGEAERRAQAAARRSQVGAPLSTRSRSRVLEIARASGRRASEEERHRLRRLQRRRLAVGDAAPACREHRPGSAIARSRCLDAGARGGSPARPSRRPWHAVPSRSRRRSCSTTRAAAAGSEPSSSGITVREISVKRSSNRADSLPSRPRSPPSGSGKSSFQGPSATDRRRRPASSTTSATASGSPWSPSSCHGAVRTETTRTPSAWGRTRRATSLATGFDRIGGVEDVGAVEAHGSVSPCPGEEGRDAPRAGEEPRPRRASDPLFHRRLGDRPERRLSVGGDANDAVAPLAPADEPDLVAEERGLGAAQRGRRHRGADRAVGEPEEVPRLHVTLLPRAGDSAAETVGRRCGDAGARVGDAQDVAFVAEREDGALRALGVVQDEPPGDRLHGPDEAPGGHAEGRLEPASRRRSRGGAESLGGEEGGRAEAGRGESEGAERGAEGRHRRATA